MSSQFQGFFNEMHAKQDTRIMDDANKYYDTLLDLQTENYGYYEKNKTYLSQCKEKFYKQLKKFKKKQELLNENFESFGKSFRNGNFMANHFTKIKINELYKFPENIALPKWFESFKEEEFEKVKVNLNNFAQRLYRSKITENFLSDRKKLVKKIHLLIQDIEEKYKQPDEEEKNNQPDDIPPIIKINELQHCKKYIFNMVYQDIEELQGYDKIIPEICYEVLHKASEYASAIVGNFLEFRKKSNDQIEKIQ